MGNSAASQSHSKDSSLEHAVRLFQASDGEFIFSAVRDDYSAQLADLSLENKARLYGDLINQADSSEDIGDMQSSALFLAAADYFSETFINMPPLKGWGGSAIDRLRKIRNLISDALKLFDYSKADSSIDSGDIAAYGSQFRGLEPRLKHAIFQKLMEKSSECVVLNYQTSARRYRDAAMLFFEVYLVPHSIPAYLESRIIPRAINRNFAVIQGGRKD